MSGHGHDGSGAISHQHIIRDPDGNLLSVHRVRSGQTLNLHAGLVLGQFRALEIGLLGSLLPVGAKFLIVADLLFIFINQGMFRRHHHIGGTKQRVRPGGIDTQLVFLARDGKIHLRALALADPVLLRHLHPLHIVHIIQILDQPVRILGNLQHPLALDLAYHRASAALAHTVYHLFVGQAHLAGGTPVNGHLRLIGQPRLEQL